MAKGILPAAGLIVSRGGVAVKPRVFGRLTPEPDGPPANPETIFLIASVTKPVTATAAMMLVERGKIALDEYVASIVPEFTSKGKDKVQVRHLLTHTSGLPDQLPENIQLRKQHQGLDVYVKHIYDCELLFPPGTNVRYQSCGIAMLGEILKRVDGRPLPQFLDQEVFKPLDMKDSALGARRDMHDRIAQIKLGNVDPEYGGPGADWNWNTEYWWSFAAPWGGMFTTLQDYTIFLQMFLNQGSYRGRRILSPATVTEMTRNQLLGMGSLLESVRLSNAWGYGWHLKSPSEWSIFGNLTSQRAYGHAGATGTAAWADPEWQVTYVLFTTQPSPPDKLLTQCANVVIGALDE